MVSGWESGWATRPRWKKTSASRTSRSISIGQARLLLTYAGEIEGRGRSEDDLAYLREESEFFNFSLVEQPNGDFAHTLVRQMLLDAFQLELYEALQQSCDSRLAEIAAKALKETRYHFRYSAGWVVRLGDGTEESHARSQSALDQLWRFTREFFLADDIDEAMASAKVAPRLADLAERWSTRVDQVLQEATLQRPPDLPVFMAWQARAAQRAPGLSARRDAVFASRPSGRKL